MRVQELIDQLLPLDPDEDIFIFNGDLGEPMDIVHVGEAMGKALSAKGIELPKVVRCIF